MGRRLEKENSHVTGYNPLLTQPKISMAVRHPQKLVMSSSLLPERGGKRESNGSGSEKGKLMALLYDNQRLIASEQTSRP